MSDRSKELRETSELKHQALKLGIEIPGTPSWWWDDSDELQGVRADQMEYAVTHYLTDQGKAGVRRLIREENRKNVEWWIRVVGSIISLLTGLVGTLIGLFAVLKR